LLLDRQGNHQTALENYRASLKTIMDAMAADPSVDPGRGAEMKYSIVVGRALCKLGQKEEGVKLIRHGVELTLRLIESEKGNRQNQYYGTEALGWAVDGLGAAGLNDEAKSISLKMIGWAEEMAQNAPGDGGPRLRLAIMYEQLGDVYAGFDSDARKIGKVDATQLSEARRWYQKGLDAIRELGPEFRVPEPILQEHSDSIEKKLRQCGT
jgi:hypothetical protein